MIDVIVITYNEALNLPTCLDSLQGWTRKVFVIDSGSTDGTVELARQRGAEVVHHDWPGYAEQKNWAMDNLPLEAPWVLILDADESITPELRQRLVALAAQPPDKVPENGFFVNRLTYFMDQPIRHCGYYPSWNLRLLKRGMGRYEERAVHEHVIMPDPVGYVREPMLHWDRRGLEHYFAKHNRYSTLEAQQLFREITAGVHAGGAANLTPDTRRRRWLKRHVVHRIPLPGLWRFLYMYLLRGGILDGCVGFQFCRFIAGYDNMVALKLRYLLQTRQSANTEPTLTVQRSTAPALALPEGSFDPKPPTTAVAPNVTAASIAASADVRADRTLPPGPWPPIGSVPVSILIPVKNEQQNIAECIRHVLWADQIVIVDSQSTDQTVPIAQAMGAEAYQFKISHEGWPKKKNWALENVTWRNDWVMIVDADEHITPPLAQEIQQVVTGRHEPRSAREAGCGDGYWVNRRFMFMGRWIKGCGYYPSYNVRLFKHRIGRYERIGMMGDTSSGDNEVHEHVVLSTGQPGYLRHEFLHYAYPDLSTWIEKHNRYSTWEAHAMIAKHQGEIRASFFGGPIQRRRRLKQIVRSLPFRPALRFLYSYILERGFLDGYPGLVMCRLIAWYEFISIAKYHEMRNR